MDSVHATISPALLGSASSPTIKAPVGRASKSCLQCKEMKCLSSFTSDRRTPDGLARYCRECRKAQRASFNFPITDTEKRCRKCNETKPASCFSACRRTRGGLYLYCKDCTYAYLKSRYERMPPASRWHRTEAGKRAKKEWRDKNRDRYNAKTRAWHRLQYATNRQYRLSATIRVRMRDALRAAGSGLKHSSKHLGCTAGQLKWFLQSQFTDGMTWETRGLYGWHIDHIKPLHTFDLRDPEQLKEASHFRNLRPMWGKDNISEQKFCAERQKLYAERLAMYP